jgi:4'-phosphopantetheinyl transferase
VAIAHLRKGEVHVWLASQSALSDKLPEMHRLLDGDEMARAARFKRTADRRLFVASHGLLRRLIGCYTGLAPERISYRAGTLGRPQLANLDTGAGLDFSLSHAGDRILCGFAIDTRIGVDLEAIAPVSDVLNLSERYFAPKEVAAISALPDSERLIGFYRCWTRKEAYLKATGEGITKALDNFSVPIAGFEGSRAIDFPHTADGPRQWRLWDIPVGAGYAGALATLGRYWNVRFRQLASTDSLLGIHPGPA